jgi:integrase
MARNIYHRKDGRFEGRYVKGYGEDGKKQYGSVFGRTYAEVKEKLGRIKPPSLASPNKIPTSVVDAVMAYLESLRHRIKPSTKGIYARYLENHIVPFFGNTQCDSLTPEMLQSFIDRQIENGLSAVTVQSVFSFLKAGLKSVRMDIFTVSLPKKPKTIVEYFSLADQKRLEKAAKASEEVDYLAVTIPLYTGVRIGELCGLQWCDIDFDLRVLRVRRTMQRIRSEGEAKTEIALLTPKSETSTRNIPLPDFMLALLEEQKTGATCEYVLSASGKAVEPRFVQRRFKRLLVSAEVKDVNFHTTRHTFATRALENGFDIKSLSEILGHNSATVTLNKYAHALDEHKRVCMNGLSAVFSAT